MRILLLGGTAEARDLSRQIAAAGHGLITSLAGVTDRPAPQGGALRQGGFGGADGLATFLRTERITHLIDATHPFAVRMKSNAIAAALATGCPILRVLRPAWPTAPEWRLVPDLAAAAAALPRGARVFLSTGRNSLQHFAGRDDVEFHARVIDDRPGPFPLARGGFLIGRPPFSVEEEAATLRAHRIDVLVSRNSGGTGGIEKLLAARTLGLDIVMVERPAIDGVDQNDRPEPVAETVAEALAWLNAAR